MNRVNRGNEVSKVNVNKTRSQCLSTATLCQCLALNDYQTLLSIWNDTLPCARATLGPFWGREILDNHLFRNKPAENACQGVFIKKLAQSNGSYIFILSAGMMLSL